MNNILHLVHNLSNSNGIDRYIRNFIESSSDNNIIVAPENKITDTKDIKAKIIPIDTLFEINDIVKEQNINIFIIHYSGARSFKNRDDILSYKGKFLSKEGKPLFTLDYDSNVFSYLDTCFLDCFSNREQKNIKIIVIDHAGYKLPEYANYGLFDALVSVSKKAQLVNDFFNGFKQVIYPCLASELINNEPVNKPVYANNICFGWLGNLSKFDGVIYQNLKEVYGNIDGITFIFAGEGFLDNEPPNNFKFIGNTEPSKFFSMIDVFLYPTSIDSFSQAFLEALSQNKLCLVSNEVKELAEMFGNAFTFDNHYKLNEMIDSLIYNPISILDIEPFRDKVLEEFSPSEMQKSFTTLFQEL